MNEIIDFETANKNGTLHEPMMIICPEKFDVLLFISSVYLVYGVIYTHGIS